VHDVPHERNARPARGAAMPQEHQQVPRETTAPSVAPASEGPVDERQAALGNQAIQGALGLGGGEGAPPTVPRGGREHTVVAGDTLWRIAAATYGSGAHWRAIMAANPGKVHRGGDLILVGEVLRLPVIEVPELRPDPVEEPATGGDTTAAEPRGVCTEYGDFTIYPDDYE